MADITVYAEMTEGAGFTRWSRIFEDIIGGQLRWVLRENLPDYRDVFRELVDEVRLFEGKPLIGLSKTESCRAVIPFIDQGKLLGAFLLDWQGDYKKQSAENAIQIFASYLNSLVASLTVYDELAVAHTVWQRILTTTDVGELSKMILQEVLSLIHAVNGAIFIVDEEGNLTATHILHGGTDLTSIVHGPDLSLSRYRPLLDHAVGAFVDDADPLAEWMRKEVSRHNSEKTFAIRLSTGTNITGIVAASLATERSSSDLLKVADLELILEGGAASLANALNVERMRARQKALAIIHAVHRLMTLCDGVDELLPRIAVQAANLLGARKCAIMRVNPTSGILEPAGSTGSYPGEVGTLPLQQGEGIPGWVVRNYNAVIIRKPRQDPRFHNEPPERYLDEQYLAVPMIENYEIIGVVIVSDRDRPFAAIDRDILFALGEESVIAIRNAEAYDRQRAMTLNALRLIANLVETGDPDVPGYTERVAAMAEQLGRELAIPHRELTCLRFAALLHDSGAMGGHREPDESLHRHVRIGMRIAESIDVPDSVLPVLEHHHENFRGDGLPDGLAGTEIPMGSRIIAVADAYIALRSDHEEERALAVLERLSGSRFDPEVVQALGRIVRKKEG